MARLVGPGGTVDAVVTDPDDDSLKAGVTPGGRLKVEAEITAGALDTTALEEMLDGVEPALGEPDDAESETGDGSLIGLTKNLRARIADLQARAATDAKLDDVATELAALQPLLDGVESALGSPTDPESTAGNGALIGLTKNLRARIADLQARAATEASLLDALDRLDGIIAGVEPLATQATLAALLAQMDAPTSQLATEATAASLATEVTAAALLDRIDVDLSTRAQQTTLQLVYDKLVDIFGAVDGLEVTAGNIEISASTINLRTDEVESLLQSIRDRLPAALDPDLGLKVHSQNLPPGAATEASLAAAVTHLGSDGASPPSIAGTGVRGWLRAIYDRLVAGIGRTWALTSGTDSVAVTGTVTANTGLAQPLTDAQLRAAPVGVDTGLAQPLTDDELRAAPVGVVAAQGSEAAEADAWWIRDGEPEPSVATGVVTASGDTTVIDPAAGNAIRLRWVYAVDARTPDPPIIAVKVGAATKYTGYAISKKQRLTGAADESVVVNLDTAGAVAYTIFYDELTP